MEMMFVRKTEIFKIFKSITKMKNLGIFALLLMLVFASCRKDINNFDPNTSTPDPTIENYNPPQSLISGNSSYIFFWWENYLSLYYYVKLLSYFHDLLNGY